MAREKRGPTRFAEDPLLGSIVPDEVLRAAAPEPPPGTPGTPATPGVLSPRQRDYLRSLLIEDRKRRFEALRLYEPLPSQAAFHMSGARQRIIRGSNRAGKTLASMVELAWAVTGTHPDPAKYPPTDGRCIVVARDLEKIGEVIWRKLGRAGAFRMVKDPITGNWRARRDTDRDPGKPAPPLIPPRRVREISWEVKKSSIPKKVMLKNGWEINFYSSKSDPDTIQGNDVDIVVFDEEIVHHDWYPESMARLVDRNGRFWWGATPQSGTVQLFDLHMRAEALAEEGVVAPGVTEHFLSIWDNVHLDEQAKRDFVDSIDDEERRVRIDGEFAISGLRIYEAYFFPRGVHCVEPFPIPHTWSRYVAIDPGAQVGAALFCAVPPAKPDDPGLDPALYGDYVYLYDEVYLRHCDAHKLATAMRQHVGEQWIWAYLIDHHGGQLREIGSGLTPEQQYKAAFRRLKVVPKDWTGFVWGSDDLHGGISRVKEFLRVREDGTSRLRILRNTCPNLVREMERYQWATVAGVVTDKPSRGPDHLVDCLRYLVQYPQLRFRKPRPQPGGPRTAYDAFKALRRRERRRKQNTTDAGVTLA